MGSFLNRKTLFALLLLWGGKKLLKAYLETVRAKAAAKRLKKCEKIGFRVAICGAGMSGICMGVKLKLAGIPFVIYEQEKDYGGTWQKNNYPDAACDVPSHSYCYSFEYDHDWTRVWAKQPEILSYFRGVARKYGLEKHTVFQTRIESAEWQEEGKNWLVETRGENGEWKHESFSVFISAIGQLDRPKYPSFDGLEKFKGHAFHTAEWDHSVDLTGKNVIGVGTGPSAIQAFPAIAPKVGHLTIMQRSPVWVTAKDDYKYPPLVRWLLQTIPGLLYAKRFLMLFQADMLYHLLVPDARVDSTNLYARKMFKSEMLGQMGDRKDELREKMIPTYPIGCKRLGLSSDWVPMCARENVSVETSPVVQVKENSVLFENGEEVPCDVLVYATGFHTIDFHTGLNIHGKDGKSLDDLWQGTPHAYNGISVRGMPSMFMLYGYGTNLGHSSIIFMVETQVNYVVGLIKHMVDNEVSLEIKEEKYEADFRELQSDLRKTVFASDTCTSWYKTKTGDVVNNWSKDCFSYWRKLWNADPQSYESSPLHKVASKH